MEEATVREEKFHIYLNDDEYSRVIQTLIRLKNSLVPSRFMRKIICRLG